MRFNVFALVMATAASVVPALAWDGPRYVAREDPVTDLQHDVFKGHRLSPHSRDAIGYRAYTPARRGRPEYFDVAERDLKYYQRRTPSARLARGDDILDVVLRAVAARDMEARGLGSILSCLSRVCGSSSDTASIASTASTASSASPAGTADDASSARFNPIYQSNDNMAPMVEEPEPELPHTLSVAIPDSHLDLHF